MMDIVFALWVGLVTWVQWRHMRSYPYPPSYEQVMGMTVGMCILYGLGGIPPLIASITCSRPNRDLAVGSLFVLQFSCWMYMGVAVMMPVIQWCGLLIMHNQQASLFDILVNFNPMPFFVTHGFYLAWVDTSYFSGMVDDALKYIHF